MSAPLTEKQKRILGSWRHDRSENFDEYMKALGMGAITRRLAHMTPSVYRIAVDAAGLWTTRFEIVVKTVELNFRMGEEFMVTTLDGKEFRTTVEMDESGMQTDRMLPPDGQTYGSRLTQRFVDDEDRLIVMAESGGVWTKRIFRRI